MDTIQSASDQTAYKWSFASKTSKADIEALQAARSDIDAATHGRSQSELPKGNEGRRIQGPTLPSQTDLTLARETVEEQRTADREYKRKRDRKEDKERIEDMVGPKQVGREGMLEKKRLKRENDRAFRERGDDGTEMDEASLMGGSSSFQQEYVFLLWPTLLCVFIVP